MKKNSRNPTKEKESSYENPQVEMLKRQDIEAKVNLIDAEELFNLVYNANPKTTNDMNLISIKSDRKSSY